MKKFNLVTAILLCTVWISYGQSGKTILTEKSGPLYVEGAITMKLKAGLGEFGKQTGIVQFGIQIIG